MREEREGTTGVLLTSAADGLPTSCEIIAPSGHADLDAETCRVIMERARFTPGRNARGEAAGGTSSNRIAWQSTGGGGPAVVVVGFGLDTRLERWPRGAEREDGINRIQPDRTELTAAITTRAPRMPILTPKPAD